MHFSSLLSWFNCLLKRFICSLCMWKMWMRFSIRIRIRIFRIFRICAYSAYFAYFAYAWPTLIWIQPAVYQSLSRSRTLTIVWFSIAGGIYQVTEKGYVHHFVIFCMSLNQQMRALSSFQGLANNLKSVFKLVGSYDIKISVQ